MRTRKKTLLYFLILLVLPPLFPGCLLPQQQPSVVVQQPAIEQQTQTSPLSKRFDEPASKGRSAIECAIELSEKYAKLSEKTVELEQKNQQLLTENGRLKDELNQAQAKLTQTLKELAEANDLLIEMRLELNNWKTDILGFRDEMRRTDKAQLETLLKVLEILGGETKTESTQNVSKDSNMVYQNEPNLPPIQSQ